MKKFLVGILLIATISTVGCNESIVLEDNTLIKQEEVQSFEVEEIPVDLDGNFTAFKYVNNGIIGFKGEEKDGNIELVEVFVNEKGEVKENENFLLAATDFSNGLFGGIEGITQDYDMEKQGDEREFYYRDNLKDITIRLDGFNEMTKEYRNGMKYFSDMGKIDNNENYYSIIFTEIDPNSQKDINSRDQEIIILDIENKRLYKLGKEVILSEDNTYVIQKGNIHSLYYDKSINSIMAITYSGNVMKLNLKEDYIEFDYYKELNLQGYKLFNYGAVGIGKISDSEFILDLEDEKNTGHIYAVYDYLSGDVNILEKEIQIESTLENNNLVTVQYNKDAYLAQVKEDYSVELLYKFSKDDYKCISAYGVINEEGNKIFIKKAIYDGDDITKGYDGDDIKIEHSFIRLTEK